MEKIFCVDRHAHHHDTSELLSVIHRFTLTPRHCTTQHTTLQRITHRVLTMPMIRLLPFLVVVCLTSKRPAAAFGKSLYNIAASRVLPSIYCMSFSNTLLTSLLLVPQHSPSSNPQAKLNFQKWLPTLWSLPDFSPVAAGGWYHVETLCADPKQELADYIMQESDTTTSTTLNALVGLLQAQGRGYDSGLVDGEWISVLSQQGDRSPRFQKLVQKGETKESGALSTFNVAEGKFYGSVKVLGKGNLQSTVKVRVKLVI